MNVKYTEKPLKTAFYVEHDLEHGMFDWDIVDSEDEAKHYVYYKLATLKDLIRLEKERKTVFEEVLIKEGLARFDFVRSEYRVKKLSKIKWKLLMPTR